MIPFFLVDADLNFLEPTSSCLTKVVKSPESPKKKVTFDFFGKENLRQKSKLTDAQSDELTKYDACSQHPQIQDLKNRLFSPRGHLDLQLIGRATKYSARNLLYFR